MFKLLAGHRIITLCLTVIALLIYIFFGAQSIDQLLYGVYSQFLPENRSSSNVVVVTLDSSEDNGDNVITRSDVAEVLNILHQHKVSTVGMLLPLAQYQISPGLTADVTKELKQLKKSSQSRIAKLIDQLNSDKALDNALSSHSKLVIPYFFDRYRRLGAKSNAAPPVLDIKESDNNKGSFDFTSFAVYRLLPLWFVKQAPRSKFARSVSISAVQPLFSEGAQAVSLPLVLNTKNGFSSTLALSILAAEMDKKIEDIRLINRQGVNLGGRFIPTDVDYQFYPHVNYKIRIPIYSAYDLLSHRISKNELKNKVVLVGYSASPSSVMLMGAGSSPISAIEWQAQAINALLNDDAIIVPNWTLGLQGGLLILFALGLFFIPVGLRGMVGFGGVVFISFILSTAMFFLLVTRLTWLPLGLPILFLMLSHLILAFRHYVESKVNIILNDTRRAFIALAQNYQNQGQLDNSFQSLRHCAPDRALLEPLYHIGLDYERRRQFNKAEAVYDHIIQISPRYQDAAERRIRLHGLSESTSFLGQPSSASGGATVVIDQTGIAQPIIGRYVVEKELGRGAMGTVYLGADPKISRTVAIKTLALSKEFDDHQLDEVRRRFYQEAETAGKLSHPNIVTIYDVGEEHDLAYIAMDYIQGVSLDEYTHPDRLLPLDDVFDIGVKIADALAYAHTNKIVHRDVKPANIIYERKTKRLKMTDFGIACLTDNSKTRTGTILGSPFYMSPEQVTGKKVDGRADLFSLGVTLYQLFTGRLPFEGESIATLTYKITNEPHPNPRKIRSELPACLVKILNQMLEKNRQDRYQTCNDVAEALGVCGEKFIKRSKRVEKWSELIG